DAHGTSAAMHEDVLAGLKFCAIKQPLPCAPRATRTRASLDGRQTARFSGDTGRLRDTKLCHRAISKPVVHAIHFLSDIEPRNIFSHGRNDAGKLGAGYGAATSFAIFAVCGGIPE